MTEKEIVNKSVKSLLNSKSYYEDWNIQYVNEPCYQKDKIIPNGGPLAIVSDENIQAVNDDRLRENNFNVLFLDNSMCFFEYIFLKEKILKHRLTYIGLSDEKFIQYFRIDYDPVNYKESNHPESHLSFLDNYQRIPLNKPILPAQFVYIINVLIFNNHNNRMDKLNSYSLKELVSNSNDQLFYLYFK